MDPSFVYRKQDIVVVGRMVEFEKVGGMDIGSM